MSVNVIQQLAQQLTLLGIATPSEIRGCSEEEIKQLEFHLKLNLPNVYKNFLRVMGKRAGSFYQGSDFFFPAPLQLRGYAEELLRENVVSFHLPLNACVFLMHQGYEFLYFLTGQDDDPPVFYYLEGENMAEERWNSFSTFLRKSLQDHKNLSG